MSYNGWLLSPRSRDELLERFSPQFPELIAHHVTHEFGGTAMPPQATAAVIGHADGVYGIEALIVRINGCSFRPKGGIYHITWSLDRALFKPVHSNHLIESHGWRPVPVVPISLSPFVHGSA